jgi:hypothetical protein
MIKKIILLFSLVLISFSSFDLTFSACNYISWDISKAIWDCLSDSKLVETPEKLDVETWFKEKISEWTTKIATFLALWAIFAIALGSLKMVLSGWEEEGIKKAKDIIKWWIIGLLWVVSAGFLISVVVKLVYSIWSV